MIAIITFRREYTEIINCTLHTSVVFLIQNYITKTIVSYILSYLFICIFQSAFLLLADCFSPSTNFKTVTVFQIIFCLFIGYQMAPKNVDVTLETVLWSVNLASSLGAVVVPFFTGQALASCLSSAFRIHSQSPGQYKRLPLHLFLFMITAPYVTIIYLWTFFYNHLSFRTLISATLYNYTYVVLTAVEIIVSCLCFVAERGFSDIRRRLGPLKQEHLTTKTFNLLKRLLEKHIEIANFISNIDNSFSVHFLNIYLSFALRLIVYAAHFLKVKDSKELTVLAVHGIYQIIRLLFFCYRCEKMKEEVSV